jgi:hypothetical protein
VVEVLLAVVVALVAQPEEDLEEGKAMPVELLVRLVETQLMAVAVAPGLMFPATMLPFRRGAVDTVLEVAVVVVLQEVFMAAVVVAGRFGRLRRIKPPQVRMVGQES